VSHNFERPFQFFRNGVVKAKYFPTKLAFDQESKRLHSEPVKDARWITVCGDEDRQCKDSGNVIDCQHDRFY